MDDNEKDEDTKLIKYKIDKIKNTDRDAWSLITDDKDSILTLEERNKWSISASDLKSWEEELTTGIDVSGWTEFEKSASTITQSEEISSSEFRNKFEIGKYYLNVPIVKGTEKALSIDFKYEETLALTQGEVIQDQQKTIDKLTNMLNEERHKVTALENKIPEYNRNLERLIKRYDKSINSLNKEIGDLKLIIEDLSLFVKSPSLSEEEIKEIKAKYISEEEDT